MVGMYSLPHQHFVLAVSVSPLAPPPPVPQMGALHITTEFGKLDVNPNEIVVLQVIFHSLGRHSNHLCMRCLCVVTKSVVCGPL